ncbi:MAG: hypothetical protein NTY81_01670 [Candidatus Staskawiczbacteria bacterium]|nr:hypothetical protein [Candidatus Staskawiczbacteria bacterium]
MLKNKHLLLSTFLIVFLFCNANFVSASALEVPLPGLCTGHLDTCSLPEYAIYFFTFFIGIGFTLSLISFVIGAVGLIASMDSAESASNARDRMKGAVLGLILTFASFIIIQTINPALLKPTLTPLSGVPGVFLTNGTQDKPCPPEWSDTQTLPEGYTSIKYVCPGSGGPVGAGEAEGEAGGNPTLMVWLFPVAGLEGGNGDLSGVKVTEIKCDDDPLSFNGYGSFKIAFKTPGVYYCLTADCSGYSSGANLGSQDNIGAPFAGKIKAVKIVNEIDPNDSANDVYYGVIFHQVAGLENGSQCSVPITNEGCNVVNIDASAADIFEINTDVGASGDGVTFYSTSHGWDSGQDAGFANIPDSQIQSTPLKKDTTSICFNYKGVTRPAIYKYKCTNSKCGGHNYGCISSTDCSAGETCDSETACWGGSCKGHNCPNGETCYAEIGQCKGSSECGSACTIGETCDIKGACVGADGKKLCANNACETFQDCPGSIRIKGTYLVGLYSKYYCEDDLDCYMGETCDPIVNSCIRADGNPVLYCQTFTQDVFNIGAQPILSSGGDELDSYYIIPIK